MTENGKNSAMPCIDGEFRDGQLQLGCYPDDAGLTKREWFAGQAMIGLLGSGVAQICRQDHETVARAAVDNADALLEALGETRPAKVRQEPTLGFVRFHNALRILRSIDRDEFVGVFSREGFLEDSQEAASDWTQFRNDPYAWFIRADRHKAEAIWRHLIEKRQPHA